MFKHHTPLTLGLAVALLAGCSGGSTSSHSAPDIKRVQHLVVIYEENWSFDGLYGSFPGANGIARAGAAAIQVDKTGKPYSVLPQPLDNSVKPAVADSRFPANLPVGPFDAAPYVGPEARTGDPIHRFYQEQYQIDGGKMDRFVAGGDTGGLVMSRYDATNLPEGRLAQDYTLADDFFHSAFGGSFLNHMWLACACSPTFPNAPSAVTIQLDAAGALVKDGMVTPDGYAVNTGYSVNSPHPSTTPAEQLIPAQTQPTIGDRMNDGKVDWAWFAGGWNDALAGHPDPLFQPHHQPFAYFAAYADGTPGRAQHLKDETDFTAALRSGSLPAVSFVKPLGEDAEHPGYASLLRGQQHVADLVRQVQASPYWKDTAIVITYDDHGGRWDHVAPPAGDRWGPGTRVPTIIVAPFARRHFVDHTRYETVSILRFIEKRWNLQPLGARDAAAADLTAAFDFGG